MSTHGFILSPSSWLGEGKIQLSMVDEQLTFFTRWKVTERDPLGVIECMQEIQVKGVPETMMNQFTFSDLSGDHFVVTLENQALGKVVGNGVINDKVIGWEFRIPEVGFEGFEFYEKQPDNSYLMRAEYATDDQFRTLIQGKVWQQSLPPVKESQ